MTRAVVFDTYGDPDVLHVIEVPVSDPGPGQARVRVHAAGVQPFDGLFRSGATNQWMPASFPQRLGNEFAGVVEAVGDGATGFAIGDEVLGWPVRRATPIMSSSAPSRWSRSRPQSRGPPLACSPRRDRPP